MLNNKLALGTAQFGQAYGVANTKGQVPDDAVRQIVSLARGAGVDMLDTAIAYGSSEYCLGEIGTAGLKIISKLPPVPDVVEDTWAWVEQQVQASCQRLGQSSLYGLLLHRSQDLQGPFGAEIIDALEQLKASGLVQKTGISIYSPEELAPAVAACSVGLVQAPINVVDKRMVTSGWLDRLQEYGVEVHSRSAFLQGLLLMPRHRIPKKFERWSLLWDRWHEFLQKTDISAAAACLSYPLALSQVDRVIVGVDTAEQLHELIAIAEHPPALLDLPDVCSTDENLINPSNWNAP